MEEKDRSWCSSSPDNDNQAVTIEVSNSATGGQWPVSDKALAALIDLCTDICRRNGITKLNYTGTTAGNLTRHDMFKDKVCPGPYLGGKFPYIADEVNKRISASPNTSEPTAPVILEAKTPIIGAPTVTAAQMGEWARSNGAKPFFTALASVFYDIGVATGINPAVIYAQSALETALGNFGGVLNETFCNPCGLKTTAGGSDTDPNAHQRFATWVQGITAQADHLALYAGATGYPKAGTPDPRHFAAIKGTATTVEALSGRWAPATDYGYNIVKYMEQIKSTIVPDTPTDPNAWKAEAAEWAKVKGITADGTRPDDPITRVEVWKTLQNAFEKKIFSFS